MLNRPTADDINNKKKIIIIIKIPYGTVCVCVLTAESRVI